MSTTHTPKNKRDFSLEANMRKLEEIEAYFQQPTMNIEEAIVKHKEALETAKETIAYLEHAENTLQEIDIKTVLSSLHQNVAGMEDEVAEQ